MPNAMDALELREPDDAFLMATELEDNAPVPPCALVVLVSDHRYDDPADDTHKLVGELLAEAGFLVDAVVRVKSKKSDIRKAIETGVVGGVDLVLTIGGTGVGPRDKTPEATRAVIDKMVPGVGQAIRSSGQTCGAIDAATSRGICGVSGSTVVVNLAASRQAIRDGMATLQPLVAHLIADLNKYSV
ncbi:MogA/MoaB family molybdenum cofactor biosynthesis protein [Corynebacterium sanguinis]|uniref:MogA/MoaB family molybdenum cofactor biosynthesis protein n=1 Tax=Corynebacterium sanguinis TaxID=2594913 RepID=A0A6C1TVT8_9CORY|nr:MogA/MoaB family molybdenum cofactor biosynthesis protein [Corynebacterium sanguinis]MCT1411750.1 MogA/MoaB family molybdenum cofactor biosynthesis protein [Corynebacterium sanguinis]MCT1444280.1 MogA/MoaB family molybdenum cofactor biosynthesis protein [Corynebacterium sanguinis]MCT1463604.1 MogA/MoaB family molybdenum cofactor biosynthesis protein [Corynebacterium sanguinis]MCT1492839.1 MogA/MoaB family molybdenum cofactor biosynthesis protein [Corynebacterium sanguinis]MCT1500018.1 MogA/